MSWDGIRRRASDEGKEDPLLVLVRIDERLVNHLENFKAHQKDFNDHKDEDKRSFTVLNRAFWASVGGIGVLEFFMRMIGK